MTKSGTASLFESLAGFSITSDQRAADTLAAAIRKPLNVLDAAAEEAANGMLGRAKLGLLIAANDLRAALDAVDAEFARRFADRSGERREMRPGPASERNGSGRAR